MDLDGDGIISMYEMEFFYEEQVEKMEMLGIETLPFQDCLCQVRTTSLDINVTSFHGWQPVSAEDVLNRFLAIAAEVDFFSVN